MLENEDSGLEIIADSAYGSAATRHQIKARRPSHHYQTPSPIP